MSEWRETEFGELIDVINGFAFKSANFIENKIKGSLPVIKIKNVANGNVHLNGVQYHVYSEDLSKYLVKKGDVLIALTGNHPQAETQVVGLTSRYKLDFTALMNQRVAKIASKNEEILCADYIYYFLKDTNTHLYLASQSSGSANQANISKSDIENIPFSLPPENEQKAIAAVLSSLDDKIDLLHRQNKTLEAMAETLFRQWFIEEAQEDWEKKPLKDVTDIAIGRTPPRQQHQWFSTNQDDIKWISIKDLGNDGVYIFQTSEYLTQAAVEQFNIPIIPENTVVLSFKMTVGRVAITTAEMLSNEAIAHFKFNKKTPFTQEYLYLFLKGFKYDLLGSTSSIVTSINSAMIKDMEIVIPDDPSMKKFESVTKPLFCKIRENQIQIQNLEKLRDSLLPKLMSGEVRVEV
jgi:type I restriction enzyme, S subunit